jgi:hypothetical protein
MSQSSTNSRRRGPSRQPTSRSRLPLIVTGVSVLVLGVLGLVAWRASTRPAANTTGTAVLKADRDKVDLGNVRLGQSVSVAFELTNTGDAPLRFTEAPYIEVAAGC